MSIVDFCENVWVNILSFLDDDPTNEPPSSDFKEIEARSITNKLTKIRKVLASGFRPVQNAPVTTPSISCLKPHVHRDEQALRCVCTNLQQLLTSEKYHRARVMEEFGSGKHNVEMFDQKPSSSRSVHQWPKAEDVGGWRNLHEKILRPYAPLEGWHYVWNSWPWGLLVRCQFVDGKFCGDLIRAVPRADVVSEDMSMLDNGRINENNDVHSVYERVLDKVFEISFDENGAAKCAIMIPGFGIPVSPSTDSSCFVSHEHRICEGTRRYRYPSKSDGYLFSITWKRSMDDPAIVDFAWPNIGDVPHHWDDQRGPPSAHDIIHIIQETNNALQRGESHRQAAEDCELLLEPLNDRLPSGTTTLLDPPPASPALKPGLYVGDYGSETYGPLRHEVLHISHMHVDTTCADSLKNAFASSLVGSRHPPPERIFGNEGTTSGTILVATKVTGDAHVPAGEITWFVDVTSGGVHNNAPSTIRDQSDTEHRVVRSWYGMGTLSFPSFTRPSWDDGWLLELEGNNFAFCWSQFRWEKHTILHEFPM